MKKNLFKAAFTFSVMATLLMACKKDKDTKTDDTLSSDNVTAESNSAQAEFDDILKLSEDVLSDQGRLMANKVDATASGCPSISAPSAGNIVADFGVACTGSDGRIRSGKLLITYTDQYRNENSVITIKTKNYYVNGKRVDGKRTVTNTGLNASNHITYSIVDSDTTGAANSYAKITDVDQKVTTWRSTRTRELMAGETTTTLLDDQYLINGTADGQTKAVSSYSMTATNILIKIECWASKIFFPVSGMLSITAPDGTRSIDYGTGACDKTIEYTHTNGKKYTITLGY